MRSKPSPAGRLAQGVRQATGYCLPARCVRARSGARGAEFAAHIAVASSCGSGGIGRRYLGSQYFFTTDTHSSRLALARYHILLLGNNGSGAARTATSAWQHSPTSHRKSARDGTDLHAPTLVIAGTMRRPFMCRGAVGRLRPARLRPHARRPCRARIWCVWGVGSEEAPEEALALAEDLRADGLRLRVPRPVVARTSPAVCCV